MKKVKILIISFLLSVCLQEYNFASSEIVITPAYLQHRTNNFDAFKSQQNYHQFLSSTPGSTSEALKFKAITDLSLDGLIKIQANNKKIACDQERQVQSDRYPTIHFIVEILKEYRQNKDFVDPLSSSIKVLEISSPTTLQQSQNNFEQAQYDFFGDGQDANQNWDPQVTKLQRKVVRKLWSKPINELEKRVFDKRIEAIVSANEYVKAKNKMHQAQMQAQFYAQIFYTTLLTPVFACIAAISYRYLK